MVPLPRERVETVLRLIAEQLLEHAFILLDPEGRIVWWSPGAQHIFGHEAADVVGKRSDVLFTPPDVADGMPEYEIKVADTGVPGEDDRWMLRRDGSRFWATGILMTVRDETGNRVGYGK